MEFVFKYKGCEYHWPLAFEVSTLAEIGQRIEETTAAHFPTQKLIGPNVRGALKLSEHPTVTLRDAGVMPGKRYTLIASTREAVQSVQSEKELPMTRGFEEEAQREAQRRKYVRVSLRPPNMEYGFGRYEVLEGINAGPAPEAARQLLYRLAHDVGIQGIMRKHRWSVGLLSEMPPKGKVGVSARCVLGYNVNKGQEIALRLRTDNLQGFRKYVTIRETLIHELTHMVWSDHDENFKKLNAQLLRECEGFLRPSVEGRFLADGAAAEIDDDDPFLEKRPDDGRRLGGSDVSTDAATAARNAALKRHGLDSVRPNDLS